MNAQNVGLSIGAIAHGNRDDGVLDIAAGHGRCGKDWRRRRSHTAPDDERDDEHHDDQDDATARAGGESQFHGGANLTGSAAAGARRVGSSLATACGRDNTRNVSPCIRRPDPCIDVYQAALP